MSGRAVTVTGSRLRAYNAMASVNANSMGISLGGVLAPVLANESSVRGVVVYGTLGSSPRPYPGRPDYWATWGRRGIRWSRIFTSAPWKAGTRIVDVTPFTR